MVETFRFLRASYALARPYWTSEDRWTARSLLAAVVAMNLGLVYVNVLFSSWNNRFYNALQHRDIGHFSHELAYFSVLAAVFIVVSVYQTYLQQMLQIRWRRWLTHRFVGEWFADRPYYHLELDRRRLDNPDQRIANDLQLFVDGTLTLGLGLLSAVVTLASFAAILWHLSGTLRVPLGSHAVAIPGYMLWAALIYAAGGTWLTHRIGRPLIGLNFDQQRFEADFRYSLVRVREAGESIALYAGEPEEAVGLRDRFGAIVSNWWAIMKRQKRLTWFTAGYAQAAIVFPVLAAAPRYFSGAIQLGGLMQTAQAFGQVQGALSWFVGAYVSLAQWKATADRLAGFGESLRAAKTRSRSSGIARIPHAENTVALHGLTLSLPDGRHLVGVPNLSLRQGESCLITGPSGGGKSTLLRTIAGIWPFGHGTIRWPRSARMLLLPQRSYLPAGLLRRVLCYPSTSGAFDDETILEALRSCGLSQLACRLDDSTHWSLELSPGEQQRIGFVRALLHRPDWLFLDEATSALDEASEAQLYRLLERQLPNTTRVSVGHRSTLAALHRRCLHFGEGRREPAPALSRP